MFVGRQRELNKLESMYSSAQFELAVFTEEGALGKTTLINEFCRDQRDYIFVASEATGQENLKQFSKAVFQTVNPNAPSPSFSSYDELLTYIDGICMERRLILVIDEYPYLASSYKAISSLLQAHIDHSWQNSQLFLILCGSSMSFMEHQVLGYQSPLWTKNSSV